MTTKPKGHFVRTHLFISGEVQGVYFRDYTQRKAQALDLTGWVRNLWDGRVEVVFEGEAKAVQQAVDWCHIGSPYAQVDHVEVSYEELTGEFDGFRITW
ncbi:MAG: acylphosphatase [Anaerolineales bacterium]|nr:acylphosphatase [Anaerolineales bacterium]